MSFSNHPPRRLFLERERAEFEAALETVRQQLGREYPLEIDGTEVRTKDRVVSADPSHPQGPPAGIVHAAGRPEARRALQAAVEAQPAWEARSVTERAAMLRRSAEILAERQSIVAAWEVHEAAKAWGEALADVDEAIDYLRFYADSAEVLAEQFAAYRPRGIVAVIPPWNFPAAIPCGMTAAALVTGNAVILKPAEQTPLVARQLVHAIHDAGVPAAVLQWLPGSGEIAGAALVASPQVDMVAFTGSAAVGVSIYQQGSRVRPARGGLRATLAEMGGKNPILVFPDADIDEAVVGTLRSAFGHSNQKCSAASRVLVHRSIYDRFKSRLAEGAASLRAGLAEEPGAVITPLIDEDARERVMEAAERARSEGTVIVDAKPPMPGSTLLSPMLVEISPGRAMTASTAQQEIFGPVLTLIPFRDERTAIEVANGTRYALTAGIYSRSPATIAQVISKLDAGNVYVNRPTTGARVGVEPFGGHKLSGTGPKAGGSDYLWAFVTSGSGHAAGRRRADGAADLRGAPLVPWTAPPVDRAQAVTAAVALLAGVWNAEWNTAAGEAEADVVLEDLRALPGRTVEIAEPEPTIALPGQQTYTRWDTARGCGLVVSDDHSSLRSVSGLISAALLAGNGVLVAPSARQRPAVDLLVRALARVGVPAASILLAATDPNLASAASMPQITFACVDAGLSLERQVYQLLADASGTPESPRLKALITLADGPAMGEPGFLRRFALPKTVAIRTLHLGADLELPVNRE